MVRDGCDRGLRVLYGPIGIPERPHSQTTDTQRRIRRRQFNRVRDGSDRLHVDCGWASLLSHVLRPTIPDVRLIAEGAWPLGEEYVPAQDLMLVRFPDLAEIPGK